MSNPIDQYLQHPITQAYIERYNSPFSTIAIGRNVHAISPRVFEAMDKTIQTGDLNYFPLDDMRAIWAKVSQYDQSLIQWMDAVLFLYQYFSGAQPFHFNALFVNDQAIKESLFFPSIQHDAFVATLPFETRYKIKIPAIKDEYLIDAERRFVEDCIQQPQHIARTIERIHETYHFNTTHLVIQYVYELIKKHHPDFQWTKETVLSVKETRGSLIAHSSDWLSKEEKIVAFKAWVPYARQKNGLQCHESWYIPENIECYFQTIMKEGFDFTHKTMETLFYSKLRLDPSHPYYCEAYRKTWTNLISYFKQKSILTPYQAFRGKKGVDIFQVFTEHNPAYFPLEMGLTLLLHPHESNTQMMSDILSFYEKKQRVSSKNSIKQQFVRFLEENHHFAANTLMGNLEALQQLQMPTQEIIQAIIKQHNTLDEESPLYLS